MKSITIPVTLQFDSHGKLSPEKQAAQVIALINETLQHSGINSEPAILGVVLPPKVIITMYRGIPSVYSDNPAIKVEVVDPDVDDLEANEAAEKRIEEIEAEAKAGKLHCIY